MEITIKELADELGVSKPTVSKAIDALGIQADLRKVGNRFMLSESQAMVVKLQITQTGESETTKKTQEILQTKSEKSQNETEKSQILLLESQITLLQEQLTIKDTQITMLGKALQDTTTALTAAQNALQLTTEALTAAQALHAGTIHQQLTSQSGSSGDATDDMQQKRKGFWSKIFKKKDEGKNNG